MATAYVLCLAMETCQDLRGKKIKQDFCALPVQGQAKYLPLHGEGTNKKQVKKTNDLEIKKQLKVKNTKRWLLYSFKTFDSEIDKAV